MKQPQRPPWQSSPFEDADTDPLAGFANIMDVMLVFALGLMLALISQSQELQSHFELTEAQPVESGKELIDMPAAMKQGMQGQGMEPLGQVYRDPETGKLIMIGGE